MSLDSEIISVYNKGDITASYSVGGISGEGSDYTKIYNSYNKGNIRATGTATGSTNTFVGGISGRLRAYGDVKYCYNLGPVTNTGKGNHTGGICGQNEAYDGSNWIASRASIIQNCYNSATIKSNGDRIGGISGTNKSYCTVKNCYISSSATPTTIVGYNEGNVSGNGTLSSMLTVYNVVNGLSDGDSEYWSKSDLNAPKLLWEEK